MGSIPFTRSKATFCFRALRGRDPALLENVPEMRFKIAMPGQKVFEKFDAEKFDCLLEQRAMEPGELEPPVPLPGKHARNLQDQTRLLRHLPVLMAQERREASNILVRNK